MVVGVAGQQPTIQVGVSSSTQTLTVPEGGSNSYTLVLSSRPTDDVSIGVTLPADTDLRLDKTSLTFTSTNWDTAQTVTVTAEEDDDGVTDAVATLTHTISGGGYGSTTVPDVEVTVTENDTPDIVLSETDLTVTEGDAAGVTYTVALATEPSDSVTVSITGHDGTDLSLSGTTLSSDTLTFTVDDWSTAQTVTVKAGEDANADDELETLTHTASGGDYANITKNLPVTVEDDAPDTVTVTFGAASYTVAEGSSRTITVSLDEDPERTVLIPIETDDQGGATDSDYTGVPDSVTFEAGDTSKTFDISTTEDNLAEAGEKVKLSFGTLPADATAGTPGETTVSISDRTQGQDLPTSPTVHFENAAYPVDEGATVAVKVKLSKAPGSEAVIPISRANRAGATNADYSGVPDTLTFGATDTEKTITFAATDDEVDDDGEKVELSFGSLPGGITATSGGAAEATVAITDNDDATAKAIVLAPTSLTVTEEENATGTPYTVKLASQPSDDVTVIVSGLSGTDLIISGTTLNANDELTLTFTALNWDTAQTVTVKAAHDADPFGDTAFLLHTATGGGYDSASKALPVTVTDNDTAAVVLDPASITVEEENATGTTYTVKLSHAPAGAVTVTIGGHSGTALSISGTTLNASDELTFTASNWSAAQTVTVKADNDDNAASESLKLTHTPSGGGYSTAADLPVTVTDDDTAAIVLDPVSLSVEEGDTTGVSYTVELSTQPSETVTVTIGGHAGTDLSISGATLSSDTLTFTVDDWSTAQTVTVKAGEDANADDESETLTHTASGGDYANITKNLPVTVTDDDTAGVTIEPTALSVVAGQSNVYTVALATQPTGEVTVTISGHASTDVSLAGDTLDNTTLTFTVGDWDTAQTVTVSATQSAATEKVTLAHAVAGADYGSVTAEPVVVSVVGVAGQQPTIQVGVSSSTQTLTVPEGGSNSYTLVLSSRPTDDVSIGVTLPADTDLRLDKTSLTFTSTNWDTAQTVTVTAEEDDDGVTDAVATLTHTISGGGYGSTTVPDVEVTVTENDTPDIVLSETDLTVTEGDAAGVTYTVALATEPSDSVTVSITGHDGTDLSLSGTTLSSDTLTFTVDDWSTAQTVTVKAGEDANADDELETLTHTASGGDYANITKNLPVTVEDDAPDTVTVTFGAASYTVAEGSSRTITVSLDEDPERTVLIPIETDDQGGATDSDYTGVPDSVTFEAGDTSKTFDISTTEDNLAEAGEKVKLSFGTLPADATAGTPGETTVSISDRTQGQDLPTSPTVHFENAAYPVDEGATVAVKVKLSKAPGSEAVIPISRANRAGATNADYSGVPDTLTFGATDTEKTITFAATDDEVDDDGEKVELSFGSLPGGITATSGGAAEATVAITDNDDATAKAIVLAPTSLTVTEEDTTGTSYTVKLSEAPTADVTVAITGHDGTDLSLSSATLDASNELTFSTSNWNTAQTVTVKAGHDGNSDDESETLTHTASGGDYANISEDLPVTVTDDAPATVRVSFGAASYTVVEGSSRTVTVTLDADPERTVVIPIETANEGGASDSDYTGVPESVTFDAGETSKSFDVSAVEDNLSESGERVKLSFGTLPAAAAAGAPSEAAVSINDRTQGQDLPTAPSVHFEGAAYSVDEGATVAVKVKLSKAPGSETVIPITGTNRAGASDDDYSGVPGSLTFAATDTEKTITFAATDDSVDDDDEKVMLSFGSLPGGITTTTGEATEAVVTIADDDKPTALTVEFGQAAYNRRRGLHGDGEGDPLRRPRDGPGDTHIEDQRRRGDERRLLGRARERHLRQRGYREDLRLHRRDRRGGRRRRVGQAELRHAADDACDRHGGDHGRGHGHHHRRRRAVRHGELRERRVHRGRERRLGYHRRNGEHRRGDRHPQRRSRAHSRHPHIEDEPGRRHHRRLLGRAPERNLRQRRHLQVLHIHRRPRHRRRRQRERAAELRGHAAGWRERRDTGHEHGQHHRRRRPAGDGGIRPERLFRRRGFDSYLGGDTERGS